MKFLISVVSHCLMAKEDPTIKDPLQYGFNMAADLPLGNPIPAEIRHMIQTSIDEFTEHLRPEVVIDAKQFADAYSYFSHRADCQDPILQTMRKVTNDPLLELDETQRAACETQVLMNRHTLQGA